MEVRNGNDASSAAARDIETALYRALWHRCAGPFVTVPRAGELVFYFPQGHIEQFAELQMPVHDLPWKILCRVINVQLKVEPDTEEVFLQMTLLPELNQDENTLQYEPPSPSPRPRFRIYSFCKKLTASDTDRDGGYPLLKQHGVECFPPLDMTREPQMQELVAKDLNGNEWQFRHILRGQPQRHLLTPTRGWSEFVSAKRLVPGDVFVFVRGGNGQIRVGFRRAMRQQSNDSTSLNEIIAATRDAIFRGRMFTVYCKPRTSPAFIISFERYMESIANNYSIGMRFEMGFEVEDFDEQRFTGTIVGVENIDPQRWRESKWRCLEVRWDEICSIPRPQRVSRWSIEPASTPMKVEVI